MNGRVAREFRKQATLRTIGMPISSTRKLYKAIKKVYKRMLSAKRS